MARFLPALVACRGWRMHAVVRTRRRGWNVSLDLSSADGLTSHLPAPAEFDSSVEEAFAAKWGDEKRDGWLLVREGEILHQQAEGLRARFRFPPRRRPHGADGDRRLLDAGVPPSEAGNAADLSATTASCWPSPGPRRRPRRKMESSLPCRAK